MDDGWWRLVKNRKRFYNRKGEMIMTSKQRILTGDRPTARLHLGHYVGSLENRVKLQHRYDTFVFIADMQALTTHFEHPENLSKNVYELAIDYLAVGIDPEIATIFIQSMVPQLTELTFIYAMLITVNVLRHNPTIKSEAAQYGYQDLSYGFLGYPVSQAADITFCKANLVPVGADQMPLIEIARKIVRRFNSLYRPVLVEPEGLIGDCPRLVGIDGNAKMSKSLNNAIFLADPADVVLAKIKSAVTDPGRIRIRDRGTPEICTVYKYFQAFAGEEAGNVAAMCRNATVGCTACKVNLAGRLNGLLAPIREKRQELEQNTVFIKEILDAGGRKARKIGADTLLEVKEAMKINYSYQGTT